MLFENLQEWKQACQKRKLFIPPVVNYADLSNDPIYSAHDLDDQVGYFNMSNNFGVLFESEIELRDYCHENSCN